MMNLRKIIKQSINESEDLGWIRDIPNSIPSLNNRATISWEEFIGDIMESNERLKEYLIDDEYYDNETNEWLMTPRPLDSEIMDYIDYLRNNDKWEFVTQTTTDYELEYSMSTELFVYKRKSDGRYFGFTATYGYHDGWEDSSDKLHERFQQTRTVTDWV